MMYPPEKLRKYPHLFVSDIRIWEHYLETVDHGFGRFEYDVRVGEGVEILPGWTDEIKRMALALTQKRIDVVGWKGGDATIIEVKPSAGLSAIGQVLAYRELWRTSFPGLNTPRLMIVTDIEGTDMKKLCVNFGIEYVVLST